MTSNTSKTTSCGTAPVASVSRSAALSLLDHRQHNDLPEVKLDVPTANAFVREKP